jgi:sulfite exporter TauE/SafE
MKEIILQPILLGLSSGIFCVNYCFPFIAPYIVFEERKFKEDFKIILKFIFGRLFGYLLFGAIFGYLGERITNKTVDLFFFLSLLMLSIILVLYSLGLIKEKNSFCFTKKYKSKTPFLMGFLMGVNVCPPFLMALNYVFVLHTFLKGIIFFFFFFLATTIYFLPLTFLGFLNKIKEFRLVARISGILIGIIFLIYSLYKVIQFL